MVDRDDKGRFLPNDKPIGWVHGLPITPSQVASDLLAAFHLGAQTVLATLAPQSVRQPLGGGEERILYPPDQEEDEFGSPTLASLMSLDPLRREALLSAWGLQVAQSGPVEHDPTPATVRAVMEADGVE